MSIPYVWIPSDKKVLPHDDVYVYAGGMGDLALEFTSGQKIILKNLQPGHLLPPMLLRKILSTGTTAYEIVIVPVRAR